METNRSLLARFDQEYIERHSISAGRRKHTLRTLNELADKLGGRSLAELTPSDFMGWQAGMLKKVCPNTLRNRESMVRAFLGWAFDAEVIDLERYTRLKSVSPVRGARANIRPRPYKRSELEGFRDSLATRYPVAPLEGKGSQAMKRFLRGGRFNSTVQCHCRRIQIEAQVALALELGLRSREVFDSKIGDLHPNNATVVVLTAKQAPGVKRYREVPWTEHARQAVKAWLELRQILAPPHDSPWLALNYGAPLNALGHRQFESALAPIGSYTWHRFRHTFATERLRAGMSLEKVQVMMGHARLEQTLAYAEIVNADVTAQAARSESQFERNLGVAA